ncbi:unnamed protein product [Meloidogyne enterolobii]|uniref:Uncharacterized protein n=1 Tax=Meloidogyne enterolobii TaxID=390850 RepID=A0ACB1AYJ0_MELEN
MCWSAYVATLAYFFLEFEIRILSHTSINKLALFLSTFHHEQKYLRLLIDTIQNAHVNFYCGSDRREVVEKYIDIAGEIVLYFSQINIDDVRAVLKTHLPKKKGDSKLFCDVKFTKIPHHDRIYGAGPFAFDYVASNEWTKIKL